MYHELLFMFKPLNLELTIPCEVWTTYYQHFTDKKSSLKG